MNIHVKRYQDQSHGWQLSIEPEDRSFVVFVPVEGDAAFYRRLEEEPSPGRVDHTYADVELPCVVSADRLRKGELPVPQKAPWPGPIDFKVAPVPPEGLDDLPGEASAYVPTKSNPGFWARLNCREAMCWGPTEHEAVRHLLNYAVQLAVAGCLDHTGDPMSRPSSRRRYEAVFGHHTPEPAPAAVELSKR